MGLLQAGELRILGTAFNSHFLCFKFQLCGVPGDLSHIIGWAVWGGGAACRSRARSSCHAGWRRPFVGYSRPISEKEHTLYRRSSTEGDLAPPRGDICQCPETFLVFTIGVGACYWHLAGVEARDTNQGPTKHRTVPSTAENRLLPSVHEAAAPALDADHHSE